MYLYIGFHALDACYLLLPVDGKLTHVPHAPYQLVEVLRGQQEQQRRLLQVGVVRQLHQTRIILLERIQLTFQTRPFVLQTTLLLVKGNYLLVDGVDELLARTDVLTYQVQFVLRGFLALLGLLNHLAGRLQLLGVLPLLCLKLLERLTVDAHRSQHRNEQV